jgi:hypothetical protein
MALGIPLMLIAFIFFVVGKIFRKSRRNAFDLYFDWISSYFTLMLFSTIALWLLALIVLDVFVLFGIKVNLCTSDEYTLFCYLLGGIVNLKILHIITKGFSEETDLDKLPKRIWF